MIPGMPTKPSKQDIACKLDRDDVSMKPIERPTCDCGEIATHEVRLDARNNGIAFGVFRGCRACCKIVMTRLRDSLPPAA